MTRLVGECQRRWSHSAEAINRPGKCPVVGKLKNIESCFDFRAWSLDGQDRRGFMLDEISCTDGEDLSLDPVVEAFLKIGAIAEGRREMILQGMACLNTKLSKENKSMAVSLQTKDQTIMLLWKKLKSLSRVPSEQVSDCISENDDLKYQTEMLENENCELKNHYCFVKSKYSESINKLCEMKRYYEEAMAKSEGKYKHALEEMEYLRRSHRNCLPLEEKNLLCNELKTLKGELNMKEKEIDLLNKQLFELQNENRSLAQQLEMELHKQSELLEQSRLHETEIGELTRQIKEQVSKEASEGQFYQRQISQTNKQLMCLTQELAQLKVEMKSNELEYTNRISKLNKEIYDRLEKENCYRARIGELEEELERVEKDMKCEVEKYLSEISQLKDKVCVMKSLVKKKICSTSSGISSDSKSSGVQSSDKEKSVLSSQSVYSQLPVSASRSEKIIATIVDKLTEEQIRCHALVDRLHNYRMEFVRTQNEIIRLRKECSNGCNKAAICARVIHERELSENMKGAETDWKNSVAQSRALLNTLDLINNLAPSRQNTNCS